MFLAVQARKTVSLALLKEATINKPGIHTINGKRSSTTFWEPSSPFSWKHQSRSIRRLSFSASLPPQWERCLPYAAFPFPQMHRGERENHTDYKLRSTRCCRCTTPQPMPGSVLLITAMTFSLDNYSNAALHTAALSSIRCFPVFTFRRRNNHLRT